MTDLEVMPAWTQRSGETDAQYAWFKQYAETLGARDLAHTAAMIGAPPRLVREAAERHQWDARVAQFDAARSQVASTVAPDDSEALAMQYAVGIAMIRLGIQAVQFKNPAMLKVDQIIRLVTQGSEMARRGAGVADLKIEQSVQKRIEREFEDLLSD